MFSTNQIVGFFNQPYPDFLHDDRNSHKLKVDLKNFGWEYSKMDVASLIMGLEN